MSMALTKAKRDILLTGTIGGGLLLCVGLVVLISNLPKREQVATAASAEPTSSPIVTAEAQAASMPPESKEADLLEFDGRKWRISRKHGSTRGLNLYAWLPADVSFFETDDREMRLVFIKRQIPPGDSLPRVSAIIVQRKFGSDWKHHGKHFVQLKDSYGYSTYEKGELNGPQEEFYLDGKPFVKQFYVNSKNHGRSQGWHKDGSKSWDSQYAMGKEISGKSWQEGDEWDTEPATALCSFSPKDAKQFELQVYEPEDEPAPHVVATPPLSFTEHSSDNIGLTAANMRVRLEKLGYTYIDTTESIGYLASYHKKQQHALIVAYVSWLDERLQSVSFQVQLTSAAYDTDAASEAIKTLFRDIHSSLGYGKTAYECYVNGTKQEGGVERTAATKATADGYEVSVAEYMRYRQGETEPTLIRVLATISRMKGH
jgi:antitoxin component YwqK of YwqJK toxin-antitoxin module